MTVMDPRDAEEYTQALGQVAAGAWRQVALGQRLGVPQALGLTIEDWVRDRLGGYVRLSIPERREAVAELTEDGMSTREIGEVLGVGNKTVHRDQQPVSDDTGAEPEPAIEPEPKPEPVSDDTGAEPEPATLAPDQFEAADEHVSDLADRQLHLRRHKYRRLLAEAISAVSQLGPVLDDVVDAVVHDTDDDYTARLTRTEDTIRRLRAAVEPQGLRRVK